MGSKQVGKARFLEYIRRNFFSNGAFSVSVDALPLQIGVWLR